MKRNNSTIENQVKEQVETVKETKEYDGNMETMVSTGSTLLDLSISGGRIRGGGIPGGILVEVFGPNSAGKTVLLCEIAGGVQRLGGDVLFRDPEARLNSEFAKIFDFEVKDVDYDTPDTVPEVFAPVRKWKPKKQAPIHGIFADSLAALSTDLEMDNDDGDKMGMRRAKEFSQECRKTCRIITKNNYLMVCSNQIRGNPDAGQWGPKTKSTGGEAIGFYASLRLKLSSPKKIERELSINGKKLKKPLGTVVEVEVFKSTVWKPYRKEEIYIISDYGIDDVRGNLAYLKKWSGDYAIGDKELGKNMNEAIQTVEENNLENDLREAVIDLWEEIENKFIVPRKPKGRG